MTKIICTEALRFSFSFFFLIEDDAFLFLLWVPSLELCHTCELCSNFVVEQLRNDQKNIEKDTSASSNRRRAQTNLNHNWICLRPNFTSNKCPAGSLNGFSRKGRNPNVISTLTLLLVLDLVVTYSAFLFLSKRNNNSAFIDKRHSIHRISFCIRVRLRTFLPGYPCTGLTTRPNRPGPTESLQFHFDIGGTPHNSPIVLVHNKIS